LLDCLVNGEISSHVSAGDRGLHYGDGVFETMLVAHGLPRFWQLHMDRLATGCSTLGLQQTPQNVLLREVQTVSAGHQTCVVKIIITRGEAARGYAPAAATEPCRLVTAYPVPADFGTDVAQGIRARICDLRLGIQPALAGIKHLNRLEQVLARAEWSDPMVQEGILLDSEDHIISGISGNIFLVSGGRLLTPRMDRCGVRGVVRAAILQAFKPRCEQRRIALDMLPEADEVFICNAVRGILPISRIGHWEYGAGPVTREIQQWMEQQ
jgi:4-amino-4-deoxychorismate lyase